MFSLPSSDLCCGDRQNCWTDCLIAFEKARNFLDTSSNPEELRQAFGASSLFVGNTKKSKEGILHHAAVQPSV